MTMRIGHGFDVHAFTTGDSITLGGINIPYTRSLLAHSDGDVVLHALCDALLGAVGLGDIGIHFPDTDNKWKGVASSLLMQEVIKKIDRLNYKVVNADITIIAQAPKLSPHMQQMKLSVAQMMEINESQLNVKATTTERLGYIGRQEGIAVHAVALLALNDLALNDIVSQGSI